MSGGTRFRSLWGFVASVVLASALVAFGGTLPAQASGSSSISGVVVSSAGQLLANVDVYAAAFVKGTNGADYAGVEIHSITDSSGNYTMTDVDPAYDYAVAFEAPGTSYAAVMWPGYSDYYRPQFVSPIAGQTTWSVGVTMFSAGSIAGTISSTTVPAADFAAGAVSVEVYVLDATSSAWVPTGDVHPVDSTGHYAITGLQPDSYKLHAAYSGAAGKAELLSPVIAVAEAQSASYSGSLAAQSSPTAPSAPTTPATRMTIAQLQASLGGNTGTMGPAQSGIESYSGHGGGTAQRFLNGSIFSSPTAGTWAVMNGPIRDEYIARGMMNGVLGWPLAAQVCNKGACSQLFQGGTIVPTGIALLFATLGGATGSMGPAQSGVESYAGSGGGTAQRYLNGSIFYSPSAGAWAVMNGPIRDEYIARGMMNGPLGWPVAAQVCVSGACSQKFQGGTILPNAIAVFFASMGGNSGALGPSQSGIERYSASGGGTAQRYLNGSIFSSPTAGTWAVMNGSIRNEYIARGMMNGSLGWPIAAQTCTNGACSQKFQGGTIVPNAIAVLFASMGGNSGALGPAQGGIESFSGRGGGTAQRFLNGSIFSSPSAGTWAVMNGSIRNAYIAGGLMNGALGWPTAAQVCTTSCIQQFQGGTLPGALEQRYAQLGGSTGVLGPAQAGVEAYSGRGGGTAQRFLNGSIFSSATAGVGAWAVMNGAIRNEYIARGMMNGTLGWPTGPQTCANAVCTQTFQGGTIRH